ncbi:MAG: flavodoxin family protein [Candidatus Sericytochromatia bacterium]
MVNGTGSTAQDRPLRVLLIAGSQRRKNNCPGRYSKARTFMHRMANRLPRAWAIDMEDIGNDGIPHDGYREKIQSCNACVSTSMALCVWPCNCYAKGDPEQPDLMWNLDMYARLDRADAWAIIGPVNWYAPSSTLKLMFDRLVCMSGGNPREDLIAHKDPDRATALEHDPRWAELSVNHLEGRTAGFYCYGDGGGDELDPNGRPKKLRHKDYFDPAQEPFESVRDAYAPLVWQCRYSGVEVPDPLWRYDEFGNGKPYSENQVEDMDETVFAPFDAWVDAFAAHVARKGPVPPGRWRADGYEPPPDEPRALNFWKARMNLTWAPDGSLPIEPERRGPSPGTR